jgi:type III secretion protein R
VNLQLAMVATAVESDSASSPVSIVLMLGVLSLLPFILLMMTSFVRISVVLAILKSAIGTTSIPSSQIVTGLSLLLTLFVMAPTGSRMFHAVGPIWDQAGKGSLVSGQSVETLRATVEKAKEPLREFLFKHAHPGERGTFWDLALRMRTPEEQAGITERDFLVLVPAFLASELRRAFEIGFLLFLPFLVIDLVVSNLLLSLGMHMLAPHAVSLPFKLLLFVLADGWQLLMRGLVEAYV